MQAERTLMGVEFRFSGTLSTGLVIHKNVNIRIVHSDRCFPNDGARGIFNFKNGKYQDITNKK